MERKGFIGGSDVAVILGLSKYKTRLQLWLEKTGRINSTAAGEAAHWGNMLEPVVVAEWQAQNGDESIQALPCPIFHHPEHDWARANLDRGIFVNGVLGGVLEIKTASVYLAKDWDDGRVPVAYVAQVQWYMFVTNTTYAEVAVLIGGQEYRQTRIMRNDAIINKLFKAASEFWQCVESNTMPEPVTASDNAIVYPVDDGGDILASDGVLDAVRSLAIVKDKIKALDDEKEALEGEIKAFMADKATLIDAEGRKLVTYKTSKGAARTAWQKVAEAFKETAEFANLKAEHTTIGEPVRKFLLK